MKVAPGEWVLLKGDEVIAHNRSIREIIRVYQKMKDDNLIISKEPSSQNCYY